MAAKVAIQGISASFHDEAAKKYFGKDIEIIECNSFKSSALALCQGQADFCVMAIENSIAGSLLPNYNLINDLHLRIIGEVYLKIQLSLMALEETRMEDIIFIQSHPMAIRQCEEYLSKFSGANIMELSDTAACAKNISKKQLKNTAAIAGKASAEKYGLKILENNIETNKQNYTRFLILAREGVKQGTSNKASICFQLNSSVGSLANVLNKLNENKINITKIQSVPVPLQPYEYNFHLDLEYSQSSSFQIAMSDIIRNVSKLSVLGEYIGADYNLN